jgi:hypothetical protein
MIVFVEKIVWIRENSSDCEKMKMVCRKDNIFMTVQLLSNLNYSYLYLA